MASDVKVGDQIPDFEATNDRGEKVRLSDYRGKRVVLYFYPKDDTPGCTTQACGFRDVYPKIEEKNAVVLGVSSDDVDSHQQFKEKFSLPFPLLVDLDHSIAEKFNVWREREQDGRKFMGTLRSQFVIDEQGKAVEVVYDVKPVESADKAIAALS